jgi:anaerobic selenocysteine-containing dehydrogenase
MQRAHGGGNAVRAINCLPALAGHWRSHAGGVLLSTSGMFNKNNDALQRPDLLARPDGTLRNPRTINMSTIGRDLHEADPPIEALIVYNSNPVAVAPDSKSVAAGFAREDLFTVVLEQFQTDTADYADYVLPATTQLEHTDVHSTYGHLYVLANNPSIAPQGEALPNTEIFRRLAKRMGFDDACFNDSDDEIAAVAFKKTGTTAGIEWSRLKEKGWQRLDLPTPYAPFAQGGFPTPSGKCELYSETLKRMGMNPLPDYVPPYESPLDDSALAKRYPLAMISPPARNFLNSSPERRPAPAEGEPTLEV